MPNKHLTPHNIRENPVIPQVNPTNKYKNTITVHELAHFTFFYENFLATNIDFPDIQELETNPFEMNAQGDEQRI